MFGRLGNIIVVHATNSKKFAEGIRYLEVPVPKGTQLPVCVSSTGN